MIVVHACTVIMVQACTAITVHTCTMIIVHTCTECTMLIEHVSYPSRLMFREVEGEGSAGRSPPGQQGVLGGARPTNVEITPIDPY